MVSRFSVGAVVAGLVVALTGQLTSAQPATAQGVDLTCVLALEKSDAGTVNVAFPDESAVYWGLEVPQIPGTRLRITGAFPHSRYMSFTAYDAALRPFDALADVQITPEQGNTNPFRPRARRDVDRRNYTVFVEHTAEPADPQQNTIYAGEGQGGDSYATGYGIIYRIYIPDRGTGDTGGVPLPTITLEQAGSGDPVPASACEEANRPSAPLLNDIVSGSDGVAALGSSPL